jgi:hypothetical protein
MTLIVPLFHIREIREIRGYLRDEFVGQFGPLTVRLGHVAPIAGLVPLDGGQDVE